MSGTGLAGLLACAATLESMYMQQLHTTQPVADTVPQPPPDTIAMPGPDVLPTPAPVTPEPLPPDVIEPPLPGEQRPIREPGAPPPPKLKSNRTMQ